MGAPGPIADSDRGDVAAWREPPLAGDLSRQVDGDASLPSRYVTIAEIGRGAMGRVVRAYDSKLQREVALKEIRPSGDLAASEPSSEPSLASRGRLVSEARAMARLSHENVVNIFDVEESEGGPIVLVMEYVAGRTLEAWLAASSRPPREILERFRAAGRGLLAAHDVGLLHRDFKPANVLVPDDGAVKVTDFGIAKDTGRPDRPHPGAGAYTHLQDDQTEDGFVLGTPRYMAPEQHLGRPLTPATDQYAFFVALWEALCGVPPFPVPSWRRKK